MATKASASKQEAIKQLWRRGNLLWKCHSVQKEMYDKFYNSSYRVQVWLLSRRSGKSHMMALLAVEQALRKANSIIKFVAPTKLQINNILRPIFKKILSDCPLEIAPELKEKDYTYFFPNGSEIQLAGTDSGHIEKLRGGDADLVLVDEAGSCDDLEYAIKSVLLPTTLITKGKIVIAGTPPEEPDHDFIKYIEEAELRGTLTRKTINDNPMITQEQRDDLFKELGGADSESARRELFCEVIRNPSIVVLPEFTEQLQNVVVKDRPRPPFFDRYVSMDLGFNDLTAVLFAYYDFRTGEIVIEDELAYDFKQEDRHIKSLSEAILAKEEKLWQDLSGEVPPPYSRVSDINHIVTKEIYVQSENKLHFTPAQKDDKQAAINNLRVLLSSKKVIISPKCQTLIRHLRNVKWKSVNDKSRFARSADDSHYDFVDALLYLTRAINYSRNPYPQGYDLRLQGQAYFSSSPGYNPGEVRNSNVDVFKRIFKVKRKF